MTPSERKSLAEQITHNPLFNEILSGIETSAIEAMIYAGTDEERARLAMRVQAIRALREDLAASLSTPTRRGAPA